MSTDAGYIGIEDWGGNRYVYIVEGEPYVGTVQDIAHAYEQCHYSGLEAPKYAWYVDYDVDDSYELEPARIVSVHDYTADDVAHLHIIILGETAPYRIDELA